VPADEIEGLALERIKQLANKSKTFQQKEPMRLVLHKVIPGPDYP
jgi:hypothetical protein